MRGLVTLKVSVTRGHIIFTLGGNDGWLTWECTTLSHTQIHLTVVQAFGELEFEFEWLALARVMNFCKRLSRAEVDDGGGMMGGGGG